jgi:hypothetical protein
VIYLAIANLALTAFVVAIYGNLLARLARTHARERELLINQLFHAVRNPWQTPPVEDRTEVPYEPTDDELYSDVDQVLP